MLSRQMCPALVAAALAFSSGAAAQPVVPGPALELPRPGIVPAQPPAPQPEAEPAPAPAPGAGPASAPPAPDESSPEFLRLVQFELIRVGCGVFAPDGTWSEAAQGAVVRFNEHGRWRFNPARPSRGLLTALQRNEGRVCPPDCEAGFELRGMSCVAIQQTAPPSESPPRRQAAPSRDSRQAAPSRPAPAPRSARPQREQRQRQAQPPRRQQQQPERRQAQPTQRQDTGCYIDLGYGRRSRC